MRAAGAALALALILPAVATAAEPHIYVAQSLFGAKSLIHLDSWLSLQPPWEEKPSGRGVRIGVIDTGMDGTHPDLQGVLACSACWRDFVGDGKHPPFTLTQPYDDHGHGTHVAGILAARGHFQADPLQYYWLTGARGIAPEAKLIVAKAMDSRGEGSDERVAAALRWLLDPDGDPSTDDGADIVNLSIGIEEPRDAPQLGKVTVGSATRDAILDALLRGIPLVASAGNDGAPRISEPGDVSQVITVAAVDRDGQLAGFSNRGEGLDLLAPGILVSTYPHALDSFDFARDGYAAMAGTSMAAPVVAGTIALLMEAQPALLPGALPVSDGPQRAARIQALLQRTAAPSSDGSGAGIVDAQAALAQVGKGAGKVLWDVVAWFAAALGVLAFVLVLAAKRVRERRAERRILATYQRVQATQVRPPPALPSAVRLQASGVLEPGRGQRKQANQAKPK
jgi:subtilisin family serine protease